MDQDRLFHPVNRLPTPGVPLRIKLDTGEVIDGIRPRYISSYHENDLGYETIDGEKILNAEYWAIK